MKITTAIVALLAAFAQALSADAGRKMPLGGTPPDRLRSIVRAEGTIWVIVTVTLDEKWQPEGKLSADKVKKQRDHMRLKKDRLFAKHPDMTVFPSRDYKSTPSFAAVVDERALEKLFDDDDVTAIFENYRLSASLAESTQIVKAQQAWAAGYSGAGQVIAVVDTGVERTHPMLAGRVVAEACFTSSDTNRYESCPTVDLPPQQSDGPVEEFGIASARPCTIPGTSNLGIGCEHGTRVAGVALGKDNGAFGFSGVARDASLFGINVASLSKNCEEGCWTANPFVSDLLAALEHIYEVRAQYNFAAVNISLALFSATGCDSNPTFMVDIIDQLHAANIAVVIGAGNDAMPTEPPTPPPLPAFPACIANAITVAATTNGDSIASYSNMGTNVDLLAPGGDEGTTVEGITTSDVNGGTATSFGTSFSAPHVAGAFAILKQRSPTASVATLLSHLVNSGVAITDTRPGAPAVTKKRIDIAAALTLADTEPPSVPGNFMATAVSATSVSLAWNASSDNVAVTSYVVERRARYDLTVWTVVGSTQGTSLLDSNASASTLYAYRVRALDAASNQAVSVIDYATTVLYEDDPIREPHDNGGTTIRGIHVGRIREAIDAWRRYANLGPVFTYEAQTGLVRAVHFTGFLSALDAARDVIGLPNFTWPAGVTAPSIGVVIDDDHVQHVRNAMR